MRERPLQKKAYRPPKVRSERVAPPHMFAGSGLGRDPEEPTAEPSPQQQP
jgi:hypothetical protein